MQSLLFLCHRIPYPPNKGEKIRAFRILEHLSKRFRIHLGCFIDDEADWAHVAALEARVEELKCIGLPRHASRLKAVGGLMTGAPLSVAAFANATMAGWVAEQLAREKPAAVFVFSSAMAQFVKPRDLGKTRLIMDFIDVDSDKWRQYANDARPPMRWIYARESRRLFAYDRAVARRADVNFFVSEAEAELFRSLAPESASKTLALSNGIDCAFFSPEHRFQNPFENEPAKSAAAPGPAFVFTGTMDYRPNIDAAVWFARDIFPRLKHRHPRATFTVVGAKPSNDVVALAREPGITVTGRVEDVRPFVAHANVVVAPLRIARGIQNKILEGMAMAKPVVTTSQGLEGIDATPERDIFVSDDATGFVEATTRALDPAALSVGRSARQLMEASYAWSSRLAPLDHFV